MCFFFLMIFVVPLIFGSCCNLYIHHRHHERTCLYSKTWEGRKKGAAIWKRRGNLVWAECGKGLTGEGGKQRGKVLFYTCPLALRACFEGSRTTPRGGPLGTQIHAMAPENNKES